MGRVQAVYDYYTSEDCYHFIVNFIIVIMVTRNVINKTPLGSRNEKALEAAAAATVGFGQRRPSPAAILQYIIKLIEKS